MRLRQWTLPLLCLCMFLGACSRLDVGYRNLDKIIPWSLSDYVALDREQKDLFKPRLDEHLRWHCSTQLPSYSSWLQRTQELAAQSHVEPQQFEAQFDEFRVAVDAIAEQITPTSIELLQTLSDKQVNELQARFAKERREMTADYLEIPLQEQVDERAERMTDRLKPWFGKLSAEQQARVEQWSRNLGEQNRAWLDNRWHWRDQFIAALRARNEASFPTRITRLLQQRHELWTPAYRQQFDQAQAQLAMLFADLINSADAAQRDKLQASLGGLRKNIAELACAKPAAPAVANRSG